MRYVIGSLTTLVIAAWIAMVAPDPMWLRIILITFSILLSIGFYAKAIDDK